MGLGGKIALRRTADGLKARFDKYCGGAQVTPPWCISMRVVVFPGKSIEWARRQVEAALREAQISYRTVNSLSSPDIEGAELLLALGADRDVLRAVHELADRNVPVLGVNDSDEESFLTEATVSSFQAALRRILTGDYRVEEAMRLEVTIDEEEEATALNELALFPSRTASLLEYALKIDGELIWRDYSDGVIVATPTGSTAYAMSAGGPMVHASCDVLVVVSVNSLDVTRRPLVVPSNATLQIGEINSRYDCEAVIDGIYRIKVEHGLRATRAKLPALLVRLPKVSPIVDKMARKVKLADELMKMPPSAKLILKTLEYEGPLTQKELVAKTLLPDRTMRMGLSLLLEKGLVKKQPMPRDSRQRMYYVG